MNGNVCTYIEIYFSQRAARESRENESYNNKIMLV